MKILKKKMIWCGIMAIVGITLNVVNILQNVSSSTITGFASGLAAVSIVKLIQFYRISKNPQLLKKYEIQQKEERFIAIAEKSSRFTFLLTIVVEFGAIFVLILINQNTIASIVTAIAGTQTLVYLIIYYYLCKKY